MGENMKYLGEIATQRTEHDIQKPHSCVPVLKGSSVYLKFSSHKRKY